MCLEKWRETGMKFTFDWEDVVRGKIEIDAKNGLEAESIFKQMSLSERQE